MFRWLKSFFHQFYLPIRYAHQHIKNLELLHFFGSYFSFGRTVLAVSQIGLIYLTRLEELEKRLGQGLEATYHLSISNLVPKQFHPKLPQEPRNQ